MANIIIARFNSSAIALKSGKAVDASRCVAETIKENGAIKVVPVSKKGIKAMFSLTASEAEYAHRQICLRLKTAESAAFSAMSSDSKTIGLGMKQSPNGSVWFGLVSKEEKATKAAPDAAVLEAQKKAEAAQAERDDLKAKLDYLMGTLGLTSEEVEARLAQKA